jgi:hypothetical protein
VEVMLFSSALYFVCHCHLLLITKLYLKKHQYIKNREEKFYLIVNLKIAKHIPSIIKIKMQQNIHVARACTCKSQPRYDNPWPVEWWCLVDMYLATNVGMNCNSQKIKTVKM